MKRAKITTDELMEAVREHGLKSVQEVDLASMEADGSISVLSDKYRKRTVKWRKDHKALTKQSG